MAQAVCSSSAVCFPCVQPRRALAPALPALMRVRTRRCCAAAGGKAGEPGKRSNSAGEDDMLLSAAECPVPKEQQPVHELRMLQEAFLFDWATLPFPQFMGKLAKVFFGFLFTMGIPVSACTFSWTDEPVQYLVSASAGSLFIVTVLVLRLYLGWQHVGSRLLSATVEYEETGWYDGEIWIKSPQILARDRLLSAYTVKPTVERLKRTLLGLGGSLAAAAVLLTVVPPPEVNSATEAFAAQYRTRALPAQSSQGENTGSNADDAYWQRVQQFEPWALEDDSAAGSGPSMMDHMANQ